MATAAGDSTPYGGGAGGKFRKNSSRRPQATPYDRPPTALRNTQIYNNNNNSNGGWLSRIVDPASKLISASAHKFYASVFRKRLLPPPQAPPDVEVQLPENHPRQEDPSRIQVGEMNVEKIQIHGSETNGVAELEHMLKQKTFTRSEIDRLTALLHSRNVDKTGGLGKRGFEVTEPSELLAVNSGREESDGPSHDNGFSLSERTDLTPAFRSKVHDDDVASPADLAKAYMGSRCTQVSLSRLGPRNHVDREEPPALSSFQLHRPTVPTVVQKPLSNPGTYQSNSVISRSRGRSAIYNMARTPYSRVMTTATKAPGTSNGAFDGQSLSSRKPLKRRCSILENDIGSVGPIRRIRQKSNLLYPKTLGLPSSHSLLTHTTRSEVGEASLYSSPKSHSQEDRGDKSLPVSSSHVSSKSIEMGQRILQQLEKLTPPREKSSEKESRASGGILAMEVTPGMLHGKANKNLETGGLLTCLQSDHVNCKKEDPRAVALCEVRDTTPSKQGYTHNSSSQVLTNQSFKAYPENNEAKISNGDIRVGANCTDPVVLKSAEDVSKRSRTFQNGELESEASHMQSNSNMFLEKPSFPEASKADNPAFPEIQPSSDSLLKKNIFDSSVSAEKGITESTAMDNALKQKNGFSALAFKPGKSSETHLSDKADDVKSHRPSSVFPFAAGATDSALTSPGSNNKSTESVNIFKQSDNTPPSSFPGSTDSTISFKMPASTPNGNISSLGLSHVTPSPVLFSSQSSSSGSSAAGDANGSMTATINGNSSSSTSSVAFPSFQPGFKFGVPMASYSGVKETSGTDTVSYSKELAFGNLTSSSVSVAASAPPSSFQFGSSMAASTNGELQASDNVSSHVISDQVLSSAIVASTTQSMPSQPAASALPLSSGPSSLALNSNVNQLGSLTSVSAPFSFSSTSGSTGSTSSTSIFGANTNLQPSNSPVFGSTINNSSSGFSFGAYSTPSSSASSGFALGTSSVSVPANGSLAGVTAAGSTTSVFGFGSSSSSAPSSTTSSPFSFGASSSVPSSIASPAFSVGGSSFSAPSSTTSSPFAFGSSAASANATPSSVFVFGSAAPSPAPATLQPSQSIFGNGNPVFAFGSSASATPTGNNDQMSMDTMVEDTRSLASTAQPTAFGQSPTNNFAFGMAPAPSPSGPNPFQLGTQQNQFTATQNPFQASGSFDGGGSGGFSLGAGGNDKSNRRIVKVSRRVRKK